MSHLTPSEFIDLLDGRVAEDRARHATSCERCAMDAENLRRALHESSIVDAPEPSPLFWEHFSGLVRQGIRETTARQPSWFEWLPLNPRSAVVTLAVLLVLAVVAWRLVPLTPDTPVPSDTSAKTDPTDIPLPRDDAGSEEAWAAVRAAAENVGWEDAQEAGIAARPGSAEGAMMGLTDTERRQLLSLIEEELRRSGA